MQFEREGAREQELTYQHVRSFIKTAFELADKDKMPRERALYMSIGTASQFELMLRQKDIIGDWAPRKADARFPTGITVLHLDDETWSGFYTWESVPGWRWRTRTSKSKYRAAAEFDLTIYDLLMPLLEMVPMEERKGAIVKGEHGLPIRYRSYAKWWRQIAQAAGIPFDVKSMDARAGGATEAEEAGANLEGIQANLTHTKKEMSLRYIRRRNKKIVAVAEARKQSRAVGEDGGTA
ncbi:tyrosine-type recombinase/integrase [Bradyrhizobium sp. Ai1a-2]|uniref:tyrosine-type recombinase/integrase n=1 Tax=Bradyrhizobium sp. Ai1a-2 TaxID=196490 RepID=UPI00040CD5ED|nr:tyrosine-type recombinase/integrase [Bradyrhizobium sp. Ai1a-2]